MELCETCQAFDIQAFAKGKPEYRGYKLKDTVHAARHGCSFCSMLIENLQGVVPWPYSGFLHDLIRRATQPSGWLLPGESWQFVLGWTFNLLFPVWINLTVERDDPVPSRDEESGSNIVALKASISTSPGYSLSGNMSIRLDVEADEGTPAHVSGDIRGRFEPQTSTWSPSNFDAIRAWHNNCRTDHKECSKTFARFEEFDVEDVQLPTRCVEVIVDDPEQVESDSHHPSGIDNAEGYRFVLRRTKGQRGKYIALSHRWTADATACRTTKNTLSCRMGKCMKGVCVACGGSDLPISQLFKDVAILSAKVGVRFIWIDSLCIIQDDVSDWERESAKMARYYQYSWLTICATCITSTGGLFGSIPREHQPRITRLPYRDKEGRIQGHFYVQYMAEEFLNGDYDKDVNKSKLLRRGWVCQEWLLSRRCLTFSGTGDPYVECQREAPHLLAREAERGDGSPTDLSLQKRLSMVFMSSRNLRSQLIINSWLKIVEIYSGLELTRLQRDRLVALSGLAREFGTIIESRGQSYISGLWWGYLNCLLWEQAAVPGEQSRVRVAGIPSWSWASIAVPVRDETGVVRQDEHGEELLSGLPVRWSVLNDDTTDVCRWGAQRQVFEVDGQTFQPRFESAKRLDGSAGFDNYSTSARFIMIEMTGKVLTTQVHGYFPKPTDAAVAASMTSHPSRFGREMWRIVTIASGPELITGWASLEHPDYQVVNGSTALPALILKNTRVKWGGYGTSNWLGHQTIYSVLFLRPVVLPGNANVFERVGCGRLFGGEVEKMMEQTEERSFYLV